MFNRTLIIVISICLISCTKEIIQQKLTVSVTPANGGSVSPPSNSYEKGSNVSLVATPIGEYLFKQWQGSISGTSNPTSITMDADKSVTGVFEKRQYPLTLTIEGSGTVKEEVIALATQALYPSGTTVRLTAQPLEGWSFSGWSGDQTLKSNPLDIKVDKAISLKATFEKLQYPLNLKIEGNGTVKEEVIAVNTQSQYPHGTTVRLTAQPADNFEFAGWSGDITSTANPLDLKIDKTINLKALFKEIMISGYKVDQSKKNDKNYWFRETGLQTDLIVQTFQVPLKPSSINGGWWHSVSGDFNNDGWIDVFTGGTCRDDKQYIGLSFLLYNPTTKRFDDINLINDGNKVLNYAGKIIPYNLNDDNYTDLIVFTDDSETESIKLIISDGKGKYDIKPILQDVDRQFLTTCCGYGKTTKYGGDIDDIDGDGIGDMVVAANNFVFVYKGIKSFPYFTTEGFHLRFIDNDKIFENVNNLPVVASGVFNIVTKDIDNDNDNDILFLTVEEIIGGVQKFSQKILINSGNGKFKKEDVISLPFYGRDKHQNHDYVIDEKSGDIIATTGFGPEGKSSYWNIFVYKKINGSYVIDKNKFVFTKNTKILDGGKPKLLYFDYNKDGVKDIGYIDLSWGSEGNTYNPTINDGNISSFKTVFIKKGDQFVEEDYYQYDPYAKSLLTILKTRLK